MSLRTGLLMSVFVAACGFGFYAIGQSPEKKPDSVKKPDTSGKKSATLTKTAGDKPATAPAGRSDAAEEKSIRAGAEAFTRLYNAHDAAGLAALFARHAEMIDEEGVVTHGREAIETEFSRVFEESPEAAIQVDVDSVRVLASNLAMEEGQARSARSPEDPVEATSYVAIHVKIDGKWLLACVRDWSAPTEEPTPHDRLQELSWLIGDWVEESPDSVVRTSCQWHDNGNFLMQDFNVHIEGQVAMSGTVRIGWDAVAKQFRSWVFDSHGGHSQGLWLRDGDEWTIKTQGATAAGEIASATQVYRYVDEDTFTFRSYDRVIDGERTDDVDEFVVKRRAPEPAE